jgi:hypothetical protein
LIWMCMMPKTISPCRIISLPLRRYNKYDNSKKRKNDKKSISICGRYRFMR